MDAMIQAGILSTASGIIGNLRGQIPVAIGRCIFVPTPHSASPENCMIMAKSAVRGYGQNELFAELYNEKDRVYAQMSGIRMTLYDNTPVENRVAPRYPMLRVVWKPDIYGCGFPSPETLSAALDLDFIGREDSIHQEDLRSLLGALDLVTHKSPILRILLTEVEHSGDVLQACLTTLGSDTDFPKFKSLTLGKFVEGKMYIANGAEKATLDSSMDWRCRNEQDFYDLCVCAERILPSAHNKQMFKNFEHCLDTIADSMRPGALLITHTGILKEFHRACPNFQITNSKLPNSIGHLLLVQKLSEGVADHLKRL